MKKSIFIIFLLFSSWSVYSQHITLQELIDKAKAHNPQASSIALIEQAAVSEIKQLNGANLPQTSLGGSATWQSDVTSIPIEVPGLSITAPPNDQYKVTLDFTQKLYDGGIAKGQKNLAIANAEVEKQSVTVSLIKVEEQINNLFFGVLLATEQIKNFQIGIENLQAKYKNIRALVENGLAIKGNLLSLEAGILELEQKMVSINNNRSSAMEGLSLLCGTTVERPENLIITETPSLAIDKNNRAELVLLNLQNESLQASESLVRSKYKPKISLFGQGGYGRPGLNFLSPDFDTFFIGGVQVKIPLSQLYNGGKSLEEQQIDIKRKQVENQKKNFMLMTDVQKASQVTEIQTLKSLLKQDERLIDIREEVLQTADAQLTNGVITTTQYLEESNQLLLAKETNILHEVQLQRANQNLKTLLGQ